ncbi:MAG TPA: tol-pal system protein YbgF [Thermoanaerobaculia bacterium]|jgi:tol-pal system protein YbgF|nr:tol-pal system protein YbgF [Thermoanaerobaculia bacterium]
MKKFVVAVVMLSSLGCASMDDAPEPISVPQVAAPDPRIGELQTAMTELLDRLDVMNSRLARLEEERTVVSSEPVPAAAPIVTNEPAAQQQPAQPVQRALVGAQLAEDYRQAIMLFGRGKHADARRAFQAVFESDAAGDLADNALFWIGETYFAAGDYTNAVRNYTRVVNEFADQNKAPDAMFKIALTQARTGDLALARSTLQQVIERYPYSSTASSAKAELARIRF